MTMDFPVTDGLAQADFSRLVYRLRFESPFDLSLEAFLRLRRGLRRAAVEVDRQQGDGRAMALLEQLQADDPVARRRYQRPAPAFVLRPPVDAFGPVAAGETREIEVLFLGDVATQIAPFNAILTQLGQRGLFLDQGPFSVERIEALDPCGQRHPLDELPIDNLRWWLASQPWLNGPLRLHFLTPARLLSNGRPLFNPDFAALFPFVLRRVTSMLYSHCGLEVVDHAQPLLEAARRVETVASELVWEDWRTLPGRQDLGGLLGTLTFQGDALTELLGVLQLGTLLQIGKGATYGAGYYRLETT